MVATLEKFYIRNEQNTVQKEQIFLTLKFNFTAGSSHVFPSNRSHEQPFSTLTPSLTNNRINAV